MKICSRLTGKALSNFVALKLFKDSAVLVPVGSAWSVDASLLQLGDKQ